MTIGDDEPADIAVIRKVVEAALRALGEHGFRPVEYHISERNRACMEVISVKQG